ncbi:MAG: hypothetical protein AAF479_01395 [Pseudomonadota bacterium]
MRAILFASLITAISSFAAAAQLGPCNGLASAELIVEPWNEHIAAGADGEIRLTLLDACEPASGAFHLLVLSPDPEGGRQCNILSAIVDEGFGAIDFDGIEVTDVPDGLMFAIATFFYNDERANVDMEAPIYLHLAIDPMAGTIVLEEHL